MSASLVTEAGHNHGHRQRREKAKHEHHRPSSSRRRRGRGFRLRDREIVYPRSMATISASVTGAEMMSKIASASWAVTRRRRTD
jgi:hypothetical protein